MATSATHLHSSMASLFPPSSLSSSSPSPKRRITFKSYALDIRNSANLPPVNPNDPFLSRLAHVAANSPEKLYNRPKNSDMPPFLDIFEPPKLMALPAEVGRSVSYRGPRTRRPPPDLPSLLLHGRIVYIGMPLVPAVTELVIAQILHLYYVDDQEPIFLYINSSGTARDDGETVARESAGFGIYDCLMQLNCEIHTVAIARAMGFACLFLAAGTKGKRYMFPHAKAMLAQPKLPSTGLMQATDVVIRAREAIIQRDNLVNLIAGHTGNSVEEVFKLMSRPFYMDSLKAKKFGFIDKILWRGQEDLMMDIAPPDAWHKLAPPS
ncbi:hypothetical protein LguiA_026456 [Lonicera macranthoides]